jgi:hypothetical protein
MAAGQQLVTQDVQTCWCCNESSSRKGFRGLRRLRILVWSGRAQQRTLSTITREPITAVSSAVPALGIPMWP